MIVQFEVRKTLVKQGPYKIVKTELIKVYSFDDLKECLAMTSHYFTEEEVNTSIDKNRAVKGFLFISENDIKKSNKLYVYKFKKALWHCGHGDSFEVAAKSLIEAKKRLFIANVRIKQYLGEVKGELKRAL